MVDSCEHDSSAISASVSILNRAALKPITPTQRHNLFLSCFDGFWAPNHYNQRVLFYEGVVSGDSPTASDAALVVMEKLRHSLSLCLVHYYPWCGRLLQAGRAPDGRPTIDCNDAGVEFVEACADVPISRLASLGFQMQPFYEKLCQHVDPAAEDSPLLSVQATVFSDGGLSLGISQSHVVADGQALWNFMVSWSECARELPLSLPPSLDRTVLAVPNPSPEKAATWKFPATTKDDDLEDKGEGPPAKESPDDSPDESSKPPLAQCLFILPSSAIKQLKEEDGGVHTSYEVMCAHFWQRVAAAQQRPPHEPTYFFVLANCRTRLKPPLPPSYFGNAIGFDMCLSTSHRICNEDLHKTANRIHEGVVGIVKDALEGFMNWLETPGNDLYKAIIPTIPKGKGINVASSPRFPVYEVDFGWGKPSAVRSPKVPGEGEIVLFGGNPKLNAGDVEFCVCLPIDVLKRLKEDPTFLAKAPASPSM